MTNEQVLLVRSSWHVVTARSDELAAAFYAHLFEIDDGAARLFSGVDMAVQQRKLVRSLEVVVQTIDDPDSMLPVLAALGRRHVGYGVEHRHFDSVGAALLEALARTLGHAFTPEVREAWSAVYALVAAVMRRALLRAAGERGAGHATGNANDIIAVP